MNKSKFIDLLRSNLNGLSQEEINEIIYDYEEHFEVGISMGKTEEEIVRELGDPKNIAKQYSLDRLIKIADKDTNYKNTFKAVWAGIGLGFFNLVFVLGPLIAGIAIVLSFYCVSIALLLSGIVGVLSPILRVIAPESIEYGLNIATVMLVGVFCASTALLIWVGTTKLAQKLYTIILKYAKWNVRLVKKGEARNEI